MENQKQTSNQIISGLRKAVYLVFGVLLGGGGMGCCRVFWHDDYECDGNDG